MSLYDSNRHAEFLRAYTKHEAAVRAFVRRLVPSRQDADDVMQEVAIVLWEKFSEYDRQRDFRAWACGIARLKALAWLRDKGRDKLILDSDVVQLVADQSLRAEGRLDRQRHALEQCLEKVPPQDRELLARAYQPESKIQDIAQHSSRSVGGFYQWLYRMRQLLLDCMKRELAPEYRT